jgi:hypothetical protein
VLLGGFRFEHPKTEQSVVIRPSSYVWAGLFGAGYVAWIGYGSIVQAIAINAGFAVGVVLLLGVTSYVAPLQQFLFLAFSLPIAVLLQGALMVSLIRTGFRRRGWMTRTVD